MFVRESSLKLSSPGMAPPPRRAGPFVDSPGDCDFVLTEASNRGHGGGIFEQVDILQVPPLPRHPQKKVAHHPRHHQTVGSGILDDGHAHSSERVLGTLSVVAITFFFGCGGPLGSETVISIAGPLVALVTIVLYPLFFTFPYGAVVAELCTAFPEDGGFPIAVRNAFGQFWGVQVGYWSWVGNIMSTAIYPSFVLDLLRDHASLDIRQPTARYLVKAGIALILSIPSFIGTKFVSRSMIAFLVVVLLPTLIFVVYAFAESSSFDEIGMVRHTGTVYNEEKGLVESTGGVVDIAWFELLNSLFWNYDGVQMASVFGGQVLIPARVYPRAISITIGLTVLVYLLPLPAVVANKYVDWTAFVDGSYGDVATQIGGNFLRGLMILVNFATTIGMFVSSTYCESTEIAGMAQSGMIHATLGRRNRTFSSPHYAVALTTVLTLVLLALDTDFLIPVTNAFACLVAAIIFAAGVQLRRRFPHFPRPSTVPGGPGVMLAIAVIPLCICAIIIYRTLTASVSKFLTVAGFVLVGLVYSAVERWREGPDAVVRF